MQSAGLRASMSRKGDCYDNAQMETFFSSLKTERTEGKTYRTRDEARADVFDYIERFTTRSAGTRPSATSARLSSSPRWG
ncbi:IS3 family transposase [Bradyrhizobium hipponense]|uniref:IS3 family transposase n=1 Tax=Bradyrhizobium hipponense TaxID=2605638 RepID=A0A5S4Y8V0_9BRAD|nr:IS3 family transposase [Bradyrhizobium hipponense]